MTKEINLVIQDADFEEVKSAYEYGKRGNETLEDYLTRSIIDAAKFSKEIRGKVVSCF